MGNWFVPQNVLYYSPGVAKTEFVKTEFNCYYNEYMKTRNMNTLNDKINLYLILA